MTSILQKLIIGVCMFGIVAFFGYKVFLSTPENVVVEPGAPAGELVGQDVIVLVDKLERAKIDPTVFSGPVFMSLKDYTIPVVPEAQGRTNPFAPFSESSQSVSSGVKKN